ncbi:MAG: DUF4169 family protein [Sphingomonadales bacterium]|nr:DUF4169 family protein [Sphingomonadales bacterium]MDE2168110.1 DUF4169 family protein [Sphingomonadales bacterium]
MAEIINLRLARKAAARQQAAQDAAANRAKFGATRAQREKQAQEQARLTRTVDGARLERED